MSNITSRPRHRQTLGMTTRTFSRPGADTWNGMNMPTATSTHSPTRRGSPQPSPSVYAHSDKDPSSLSTTTFSRPRLTTPGAISDLLTTPTPPPFAVPTILSLLTFGMSVKGIVPTIVGPGMMMRTETKERLKEVLKRNSSTDDDVRGQLGNLDVTFTSVAHMLKNLRPMRENVASPPTSSHAIRQLSIVSCLGSIES